MDPHGIFSQHHSLVSRYLQRTDGLSTPASLLTTLDNTSTRERGSNAPQQLSHLGPLLRAPYLNVWPVPYEFKTLFDVLKLLFESREHSLACSQIRYILITSLSKLMQLQTSRRTILKTLHLFTFRGLSHEALNALRQCELLTGVVIQPRLQRGV